jgi:acetolactate synthase-1/2/3 large subunit
VPLVALGGRAPEMRWGSGSLQEIDHLPFVTPLVKSAITVKEPGKIARTTAEAIDTAAEPPLGPTFVDYPLDVVFSEAEAEVPAGAGAERIPGDRGGGCQLAEPGVQRPRPVPPYWGQAENELRSRPRRSAFRSSSTASAAPLLPPDHGTAPAWPPPGLRRRPGIRSARLRLGFGASFGVGA